METEIWKQVVGYEGLYEVSSLGSIKSLKNPKQSKILSPSTWQNYRRVSLSRNKNCKTYKISRLVLIAFCGECPIGYECAHLNGKSMDDRFSNLTWKTHQDNMEDKIRHKTLAQGEHSGNVVLSEKQVIEIKKILRQKPRKRGTLANIARTYGVVRNTIWAIDNDKSWKWLCI